MAKKKKTGFLKEKLAFEKRKMLPLSMVEEAPSAKPIRKSIAREEKQFTQREKIKQLQKKIQERGKIATAKRILATKIKRYGAKKVVSKRILRKSKQITIDLRRKEITPSRQTAFKENEIGEMSSLLAV